MARVVERYPVEFAGLFGSHARGTYTSESGVDVAVSFEDGLTADERLDQRIELTVELVEALRTDDVDATDLEKVRPEVGLSAGETRVVLLGEEMSGNLRERFESNISPETHEERMRRFDPIIERLEELVRGFQTRRCDRRWNRGNRGAESDPVCPGGGNVGVVAVGPADGITDKN